MQLQQAPGASATAAGVPLIKANGEVTENGSTTTDAKEEAKDPVSARLAQIYKRLEQIDAYSAEARAAAILAVSFLVAILRVLHVLFLLRGFSPCLADIFQSFILAL